VIIGSDWVSVMLAVMLMLESPRQPVDLRRDAAMSKSRRKQRLSAARLQLVASCSWCALQAKVKKGQTG
jgi:hypothetical protein